MGLQHYLQIFPSQLNTQFLLFITKIPCYYQILIFGGQEYNNWLIILPFILYCNILDPGATILL